MTSHSSQVKSCVTDKHDTKYNTLIIDHRAWIYGCSKYNTLISEQPYIHARWSIFTFPGQKEPRPGHGTPWVNSGTIPAIPGRSRPFRDGWQANFLLSCETSWLLTVKTSQFIYCALSGCSRSYSKKNKRIEFWDIVYHWLIHAPVWPANGTSIQSANHSSWAGEQFV